MSGRPRNFIRARTRSSDSGVHLQPLLLDKSVDDRLRNYPTWITSRNMANEASDESVQALIDAVVARYDIPQKWYALKAKVLGVDQLRDFDRMASVATSDTSIGWEEGSAVVREAYASFCPSSPRLLGGLSTSGGLMPRSAR